MRQTLSPAPWPAVIFFVVAAAVGPLLDLFWLSLLTLVFFYAFMGLSWNLMMSAGLLSLGHALFLGLGAYTTAVLTASGSVNPWLAIPAGMIISALAGSMIAWVGSRFSVRGVQFAVLTIAFAELVRVLFDNWDFVGGTGGLFLRAINPDTNRPLLTLRGGPLFSYFAFLVITAAAYFLISAIDGLPVGLSLARDQRGRRRRTRARRSSAAQQGAGGNISAGLAGLGGGLFGLMQGSLFPDSTMRLQLSIEVLIAPIVGGLGSPFGSIVGAIFVVPLMEFSNVLGQRTGYYGVNTLVYGIVILAVIAFLPGGIWPRVVQLVRSARPA